MFNISQFRELIIKSTLNDLKMYSENAEELLVFTCAAESMGGTYLTQVNGSALGIYQMMPETYNDIWENYIKGKTGLNMLVLSNFNLYFMPPEEVMIYDLRFATLMARIFYERIKEPLPDKNDINSIWEYYKKYYNTDKGAAQKEDSISNYLSFLKNL
jgi:hypothetical protein